jgi:hypothetical protein
MLLASGLVRLTFGSQGPCWTPRRRTRARELVNVDSWLMPKEFLVAFVDEKYDVTIAEW